MQTNPAYHINLPQIHHYFAIECYQQAVELCKKTQRSRAEDELMEQTAHATCYHQHQLPEEKEKLVRHQWLLTVVYASLNNAARAEHYAEQCRTLCQNFADAVPMVSYAYAMNAQAHALLAAHEPEQAHGYLQLSTDIADEITNPNHKLHFLADCGSWHTAEG